MSTSTSIGALFFVWVLSSSWCLEVSSLAPLTTTTNTKKAGHQQLPPLPVSTREALLQRSKDINPAQAYAEAGWSNRAGTVVTPVHVDPNGVYTGDRPFYWNDIDVGCRMTIIELPSDDKNQKPDLWVHSPVMIDGPMHTALEKLGNVKHVISPNYEHLKYAAGWYQNFPQADMWGCPGLAEKLPNIQFKGEIPYGYRPPSWKGGEDGTDSKSSSDADTEGLWDTNVLQTLHLDIEKNPFTGKPFFNEVIFYHAPTKTLICTDLFWNYPEGAIPNQEFGRDDSWELAPTVDQVPFTSRAWKFGMDKVYAPFFNNFMITDKKAYNDICHHILNVWDVETVIPAHGDIIRGKDFVQSVLKERLLLE